MNLNKKLIVHETVNINIFLNRVFNALSNKIFIHFWLSSFMVKFINLLKNSDILARKFLNENFFNFLEPFKVFEFQISLVDSAIQIS